jgi:hypothetical protein
MNRFAKKIIINAPKCGAKGLLYNLQFIYFTYKDRFFFGLIMIDIYRMLICYLNVLKKLKTIESFK